MTPHTLRHSLAYGHAGRLYPVTFGSEIPAEFLKVGKKVVHKQPKTFAPLVGAKENRKEEALNTSYLGFGWFKSTGRVSA